MGYMPETNVPPPTGEPLPEKKAPSPLTTAVRAYFGRRLKRVLQVQLQTAAAGATVQLEIPTPNLFLEGQPAHWGEQQLVSMAALVRSYAAKLNRPDLQIVVVPYADAADAFFDADLASNATEAAPPGTTDTDPHQTALSVTMPTAQPALKTPSGTHPVVPPADSQPQEKKVVSTSDAAAEALRKLWRRPK
jgi:hypothetical protein